MRVAPVGHRCPDCVKSENRTVRQPRTVFGGKPVGVPVVTYGLIGLCVAAYLVELVHPSIVGAFDNLGTGLLGPDGRHYIDDGASYPGYRMIGVLHGEWYRLFTSVFLHEEPGSNGFGLTHIAFNMFWLWLLGRFLEDKLGRVRFLAVFLVSALGGSVFAVVLAPAVPTIGESGAGYGLAAAYFILTRKLHEHPIDRRQLAITYLVWIVLSAGFASWQGHLGGLVAGAAVAAGMAFAPRRHLALVQATVLVGVTFVLIGLLAVRA